MGNKLYEFNGIKAEAKSKMTAWVIIKEYCKANNLKTPFMTDIELCNNGKVLNLEDMLNRLPENLPLYKDLGSWQIRTDDMEDVIYEQAINESFEEFLMQALNAVSMRLEGIKLY